MKCSICHYVGPPDGPTHNARTCPLRQTQCRRTLPEGHAFFEAGQCVSANCVHKQLCNTCGVPGHLYGTQALSTRRWKFNNKGAMVRKQTKRPLCKADFVCTMMTDVSIRSMVDNSQSVSTAAAHDAHARRVSTSRMRGNSNAQRLGVDETVRMMEDMNSDAALLHPKNKATFKALYKNAHLGAVTAGRLAASAAESSLDDATPAPTDGEQEEDDQDESMDESVDARRKGATGPSGVLVVSEDEDIMEKKVRGRRGPGRGDKGGGSGSPHKALRVHRAGKQSRTDRYAAAVAKGQRRSPPGKRDNLGGASNRRNRSGKVKGIVQNVDAAIDVDGEIPTSSDRGWPLATRKRFEVSLPVFFSPRFGGMTPVLIAHAVSVQLYQCALEDVDKELAGIIVKGAVEAQVRGYMLTSGTMCSAQVAEWLCSAMPKALRSATLPSMAHAVQQVVEKEAAAAATSSGAGVPAAVAAVAAAASSVASAAPLPAGMGVPLVAPSTP